MAITCFLVSAEASLTLLIVILLLSVSLLFVVRDRVLTVSAIQDIMMIDARRLLYTSKHRLRLLVH